MLLSSVTSASPPPFVSLRGFLIQPRLSLSIIIIWPSIIITCSRPHTYVHVSVLGEVCPGECTLSDVGCPDAIVCGLSGCNSSKGCCTVTVRHRIRFRSSFYLTGKCTMSAQDRSSCGHTQFNLVSDPLGDHVSTCKSHSGATKAHDWMVTELGPLFRATGH